MAHDRLPTPSEPTAPGPPAGRRNLAGDNLAGQSSMAMATEDGAAARRQIELKVIDNAQNELIFKIWGTTKLDRVTDAYCQRNGKSQAAARFLFDGKRIMADDTPDHLEMEDGDVIEVMEPMVGGGRSISS